MLEYNEFQTIDEDIDSVVFYGEKLLDHSGLLLLSEFIKRYNQTNIFVSNTHTKCAELLLKLGIGKDVILFQEESIQSVLERVNKKNILVGCPKKVFKKKIGESVEDIKDIEYYEPIDCSFVNVIPEDMKDFIVELFNKYSYSDIVAKLEEFKDLNILVIGETIIDEYIFTTAMNKSNKEPIIASQYKYQEKYAGGILAVANHLANFSNNVKLITRLGDTDTHEDFIKSHLNSSIEATYLIRDNSPTIRKQRIVEEHLARKMFEIYFFNNKIVTEKNNAEFEQELLKQVPGADLVILIDYGHGLFTDKAVSIIDKNAKFLSVNTQTNAGNKGFNLISKYKNADFIAIDSPEAQLECRNKEIPIKKLIYKIADNTKCDRITITMGKQGNLYLHKGCLHQVPMLSVKAIDTTGAGDTFFSIASCAAAKGFSPDLTGFLGNIAGAEACLTIGNKNSISKSRMKVHIKNIAELSGIEYE